MGIQFRCFGCEHAFNVKDFQAGKKAKCPKCNVLLRVPNETSDYAIRVETTVSATPQTLEASPTKSTEAPAQPANNPAPPTSTPDPTTAAQSAPDVDLPSGGGPESTAATTPSQSANAGQPEPASDTTPPVAAPPGQAQATEAWFVNIAGSGQFGPADSATMHAWISEGRILPDSLVWIHPWPEWVPAAQAFPKSFVANPSSVAHPQAVMQPSASSQQPGTAISPSEVRRISKRQKRKQNYRIALIGLVVVAIILVIVLAVVLTQQG